MSHFFRSLCGLSHFQTLSSSKTLGKKQLSDLTVVTEDLHGCLWRMGLEDGVGNEQGGGRSGAGLVSTPYRFRRLLPHVQHRPDILANLKLSFKGKMGKEKARCV